MRLQLDTTNKTIKIEKPVNLGELTKELEKLLPTVHTITYWGNPITIEPYKPWITWITYTDGTKDYTFISGIYNVEK